MFKIVPLTNEPNQKLSITLPIDGGNISFDLECRYNSKAGNWTLKATNTNTGEIYFDGLPLLYGVYPSANQLEQLSYKRIGSITLVKNGDIELDMPNDVSLGNQFFLLWGDTIG